MVHTGFVDTSPFWRYSYGEYHPLKMYRLYLTQELQRLKGLLNFVDFLYPKMADLQLVRKFHEEDYLKVLEVADKGEWKDYMIYYGLGTGDCPVVPGIYTASLLAAGSSQAAAEYINLGGNRAFNMAGGLHHAMSDRASGFCYINDPVVAIYKLLERFDKVLYLDIDAHHGDGVQEAFYKDSRVLTISTHESGKYLFPGTGFEDEMGEGEGFGYALNFPFPPNSGDDVFIWAFENVIKKAIRKFNPSVVVLQSGADAIREDPLTHWNLTTNSYIHVYDFVLSLNIPVLALGGGGYNVGNVCRLWTILLSKLLNVSISDEIPREWKEKASKYGVDIEYIFDKETTKSSAYIWDEVKRVADYLNTHHPLLK
ncbi:MAG: acetoin utilization protein AcuC [candidate division WOR-3 bacterium]